ncbi:MAG: ABC transporter permease [Pseudomonadota bacterium]
MWTIYLKEMLELVRDRKTLIFTILIPILALPLIFGSFAYLSATIFKNAQRVELKYAVFGTQHSPALAQRFAQSKGFSEVPLESIEAIKNAIDDDRIKFALIIPAGFDSNLAQGRQATVDLHYNSAVAVDTIEKRVRGIINTHNTELRQVALSSLNLSKDQLAFALNPIKLDERSTAGKREQMGALIGGILPYILLSVCLMAAMYPAIDLGAGEKERGTLESLLLAPVPRSAIVFAKFGVLFTVGLTSALLMVLSIGALLFLFGHSISINVTQDLTQILRSIGPLDLAMLGLMLVPTSAIFASLLLSLSIYAHSFKEAQGMIQPLILLVLLPIILALLPGIELNSFWAMVPLTNVSLAMKELIKGTMDYRMFLAILLSTSVIAGGLLSWCQWWFNREDVLFRH